MGKGPDSLSPETRGPRLPAEREVRERALALLATIVVVIIGGYVGASWFFAREELVVYLVCGAGLLAALVGLGLVRARKVDEASGLLAVFVWLVVATLVVFRGAGSPHVGAFMPALVGSAILVSARTTLVLTGLSVAVVALSGWLETRGFFVPGPGALPAVEADLVSPIAQILATGTFTTGLLAAFRRTLDRLEDREADVARSRARYLALYEESPDGIVLLASSGAVRALNASARRLLECPESGLPENFLALPLRGATGMVARRLVQGTQVRGEVILDKADRPRVLSIHSTPFEDRALDVHVQFTIRDITQVKEAEEAERALHARLRRSERMEAFGQLAGSIAHDFNNVLTGILGNIDLVRQNLPHAEERPRIYLDALERSAERGASVTKQLLAFSRRGDDEHSGSEVGEVVSESLDLWRRSLRENIVLRANLEASGRVALSPSSLEQIVLNLVLNACDAMPRGGEVRVSTTRETVTTTRSTPSGSIEPGRYVRIEVEDGGDGMSQATLARVFEPFFTTKPPGQGTGLGLSTVQGIVRRAGGFLELTSTLGRGSLFVILLPESEGEIARLELGRESVSPSGERKVVLVCEDEEMVRRVVSEVLLHAGYQVHATESPREALEMAEVLGSTLALLLTDVILPEMDGPSLAKSIARRHPNLPILFVSGYTAGLLEQLGIESDDRRLLTKPFSPRQLLDRVAETIASRSAERAITWQA